MHFSSAVVAAILAFSPVTFAAVRTFAELSISDGTAGDAAAEATAKLPSLPSDLSTVSAQVLNDLEAEREIAEDAETTFNSAVAAASGAAATALQNGKIKNKVLKLTFFEKVLAIKVAQGGSSSSAALTDDQTKLKTNIGLDTKANGQASTTITFTGKRAVPFTA